MSGETQVTISNMPLNSDWKPDYNLMPPGCSPCVYFSQPYRYCPYCGKKLETHVCENEIKGV